MNYKELLSDIETLLETQKALEDLQKIPPRKIERALALLSDRRAVHAVMRLLQSVSDLQRRQEAQGAEGSAQEEEAPPVSEPLFRAADQHGSNEEEAPIEDVLVQLFADRRRFPSVSAVQVFAKKVFGVRLENNRQSRDAFVKKVINAVVRDRNALRHVRRAVSQGALDSKDAAYSLLYNFIRQRGPE